MAQELSRRLTRDAVDGDDVESIQRRLAALQGLSLLLLLSAVWAMVFKPTL